MLNQKGFAPILIVLVLVIALVIGAALMYFYINMQKPSESPSPSPSPVASPVASPVSSPSLSPSPVASPSAAMLENIKASVVSKNTAALEGYMTEPVNVIIEATECCGNLTRVNAIKEMDYLNNATLPWNFDDNNPIAAQLRVKNPTAFPQGIILGTSANRMLVTFTLNEDKTKITKVYMAVDYKLHGI